MSQKNRTENDFEAQQRILDPHRAEEQDRVRMETEARLASRGIETRAEDGDEDVADLLEAIERFENAVERRGGDLMVNRIGSSQPQDPEFVPPVREAGEGVAAYTRRIEAATTHL